MHALSRATLLGSLGLSLALSSCATNVPLGSSDGRESVLASANAQNRRVTADRPAAVVLNESLPYCHSSVDCRSGEFCKDRGDGIKLCMGDGRQNDFCKTGIDCGRGLFCKDRGDGLKVCMSF